MDCARQLEPNNRPPFLAKRLYCERQLTAEYAHAHSRCHDDPHAARTMSDTSDARIIPDTLCRSRDAILAAAHRRFSLDNKLTIRFSLLRLFFGIIAREIIVSESEAGLAIEKFSSIL